MNTSHCETEFRWLLRDDEKVLQSRTTTHGISELDGPWDHSTPWRDVPSISAEEAESLERVPEHRLIAPAPWWLMPLCLGIVLVVAAICALFVAWVR
jgi:hypothetical protein